ncbi:DegT/DnrJ/EryC1/StrS family aminotransferase [Pseudohoeflea coraliihabitans]|uniref:DegT/DnrJ/EryC1/StrS family aminotransferase n=1 Tax=Pseudohoeflea coraliihabitans TaxID=2860393 RepID=A0ABS6WPR1_9HYPH|nr:DegT/DnrJ/EryC1/StrS family aminotransferase [Pseudohoeflea sp. DP4N28-3]MBW3097760.1 DegT/DnrJ/EryC1/StrS family aminotransferase [Pseudohoeflea sp. DP4N28-3]
MVQYIDLKSQYARLKDRIDGNIAAVLDSGQYVLGQAVKDFETEIGEYLNVRHAIGVSNGTDAIIMALLGLELTPKDAVFVPSFTYVATAEAILMGNATPVFVDVDEKTFNIDLADLEARIEAVKKAGKLTPRAVIAVDLFGQPADYTALGELAAAHDLFVIADAAQSIGGKSGNRMIGSLADCTTTSFYPTKPLGCYGDGGMIFTDNDRLAEIYRSIRAHGEGEHRYDVVRLGMNARLDSIQAAVLSAKLQIFEDELDARERVARIYDAHLKDVVTIPARVPDSRSAWAQYTVQADDRDALRAHLAEDNLVSMVFYAKPMHLQKAYEAHGEGVGSVPVSERLADRVLSLPMNPYLSEEDVHRVCERILDFYK